MRKKQSSWQMLFFDVDVWKGFIIFFTSFLKRSLFSSFFGAFYDCYEIAVLWFEQKNFLYFHKGRKQRCFCDPTENRPWLNCSNLIVGQRGHCIKCLYPDHFFCSLFSGPYRPDFFIPRFYPQNLKHLQQYHRPKREQTENGKISIFRCVLHRSSQNSLFGQVAGPFQEIISQPHMIYSVNQIIVWHIVLSIRLR